MKHVLSYAQMFSARSLDRSSVWYFIIVLTIISFPWSERFSSIGIILLVFHWLIDEIFFLKLRSFKMNWCIGLMWSFFLLHFIQLPRGISLQDGWHSIEVKMSFFILPLLFATENYFTPKKFKQLMWFFVISLAASFVYAVVCSFLFTKPNEFVYIFDRMKISSALMGPNYYANYFSLAIVFIGTELLEAKHKFSRENLIYWILGICFLIVQLFLISKTAWLFMAVFFIYAAWHFFSFLKNSAIRIIIFLSIVLLLGFSSTFLPPIRTRIHETRTELKINPSEVKIYNSSTCRKIAWGLEWDLIKKRWLVGYGTGSANPLLLESLKKGNYTDLVKHNMHTHNQLFHTWLDLGLAGLLILLSILGFSFFTSIVKRNVYLFWITLLTLLNCITDDMLEIQAGCVFFIFVMSLLLFAPPQKKTTYS